MNTYPKSEKLKLKKHLQLLFAEGKVIVKHPVRMIYVPIDCEQPCLKVGVSVSKRSFKKAVDRNYYKRLLREAYRLNQQILKRNLKNSYALMLFYQSKSSYPFAEIEQKVIEVFKQFVEDVG